MSTSVTWPVIGGSSYSVPAAGEVNWASLSDYLIALQNAQSTSNQKFAIRIATTTPVTVASATDCVVVTNLSVAGAVAVNLPAGVEGQMFAIVDGKGDANTNNITIDGNGAETINGSANYVINRNRGGVVLVYKASATNWTVVAEFSNIAAGTIPRSSIAAGTPDHVVINDGSGLLSSEAQLAGTRGGTGVSSTATFPTSGVVVTRTSTDTGANRLQNKDLGANNVKFVDNSDTSKTVAFSASGASASADLVLASVCTADRTITFPDATTTVVGTDVAQTLSSKTLASPTVTGDLLLQNVAGSQPTLQLSEDPDNGTNKIIVQAPATLAADWTCTLPANDGSADQFLQTNGSGVTTWATPTGALDSPTDEKNFSIAPSVAANALTVALKDKAGSDPSVGSPANFAFRNATNATGDYSVVSVTSALSLTVPSGATLGHTDADALSIYVYLLNNAGTAELAVSSALHDTSRVISTTVLNTSSDDKFEIYSTTARTDVPFTLIGRMTSSQTTAGTWAAAPTVTTPFVPVSAIAPTSMIRLSGGNGMGSTNTYIRRFVTIVDTRGVVAYTDSATNGGSITIGQSGVYSMSYSDLSTSADVAFGISVNSTQLTTGILSINNADRLIQTATSGANFRANCSVTVFLYTGDVIRAHVDSTSVNATTDANVQFVLTQLARF